MKKLVVSFIAVLGLVSCQQQKIAYVDNGELVNEYQEKKDVEAKFKTQLEDFQKTTDSISQAFQVEYQKAGEDAKKLSQKKAQELSAQLQQKGQQLGQQLQFREQQIQQAYKVEIDSIISKVKDHVKEYGKANGYTYILGSNEGGSVMFGTEENDITKVLLEDLNNAYGAKEEKE